MENVFVHDEQHRASVGTDHISFKESPDRSYFDSVKSLLHQMSVDAATKHLLEKETRLREQQVVDAWQREQVWHLECYPVDEVHALTGNSILRDDEGQAPFF